MSVLPRPIEAPVPSTPRPHACLCTFPHASAFFSALLRRHVVRLAPSWVVPSIVSPSSTVLPWPAAALMLSILPPSCGHLALLRSCSVRLAVHVHWQAVYVLRSPCLLLRTHMV